MGKSAEATQSSIECQGEVSVAGPPATQLEPIPKLSTDGNSTNFWLAVINGTLASGGTAFFAAETVMAGLVHKLTGSPFCVGLTCAVFAVGWLWPAVFVGSIIEHQPRKMPVYILSALGRLVGLVTMATVILFWRGSPMVLFGVVLVCYAIYSSAGGVCTIPFMDIVGKTVPRHRLHMLFSYRQLFAGIVGFLAGVVAVKVLSEDSAFPYPQQYAFLVMLGVVVSVVAYIAFMSIREPADPAPARRVSFVSFLKRGPVIFRRDPDYRRMYVFRCFWALAAMSQAVFVSYGIEYFHTPYARTGWFAAVVALAGGVSSFVWGRVSQRYGEVTLLRVSAAVQLFSPLTALLLAAMLEWDVTRAFTLAHYFPAYLIMFGCGTAALNGYAIAATVYLLSLSPPDRRPTYVGFMNTLCTPLTLSTMMAGLIAEHLSYPLTFACSTIAAGIALAVACRLRPRRDGDYPDLGLDEV